ncbi:hypothetical protein MANES_13G023600v8 [Manihot esculenta]|uniref:Uncharacterized protein n=1 Tax=Manihot esculenta TaxID=3983 RepID=A0A2C9UNC1_MANES|nr:hypothetical protein MANES_13G023600v8 [Manihot esculenta]
MESGHIISKTNNTKVEIPSSDHDNISSDVVAKCQVTMPQLTKNNCLCSPTTHAGSFRCRLHRGPNLRRTKGIDSALSLRDSASKVNATADDPAATH